MPLPVPYLSVVIVARNDNYGGDFNERLNNAMHWLACLLEKNRLTAELLIVDYSPVSENKPLMEMLDLPKNRKYLTIRILHVPTEMHQSLINPQVRKTVPLFEFIAKNMAIRRAKGEYILCTNADILFHPSIILFIANNRLNKMCYYRTDRFDYKKIDYYDFNNPHITLHKIQQKVFRLMLKGYAYKVEGGENFFEEYRIRLKNSWRLFLDKNIDMAQRWELSVNYDGYLMKYHTHCSGDFMLMHRDNWFNLRGYPEDTYISTHCDALFTVMSDAAGLKEAVLPWPVYHQDHERRYNTDFDKIKNDKDINEMFQRLLNETREMEKQQSPKIINSYEWGFASQKLSETVT